MPAPADTVYPARTRSGLPLEPGRGVFLPPFDERAALMEGLPAFPLPGTQPTGPQPDPELLERAAGFDAPMGPAEPSTCEVEDRVVDGPHGPVPIRLYRSREDLTQDAGPLPALLHVHGGGFFQGGLDGADDLFCRGVAERVRCVVIAVDYHLCAPEGPHFPVPHDDCWAALTWLREHAEELGVDLARLALSGGSAGANLACGLALRARDEGVCVSQVLLYCPLVHGDPFPEASVELARTAGRVPVAMRFESDAVTAMNTLYAGGPAQGLSPYAFPGNATDLTGFPPTYIENCEMDDLRASGEAFATQLRQAGVEVECVLAAGVPHGHIGLTGAPTTSAHYDRMASRFALLATATYRPRDPQS